MKPFRTPSDQELQRQLQKLLQEQKATKDIEAQLRKVEKQLDALEAQEAQKQKAKKAHAVAEKPKPRPKPTTTLQTVSKAISDLYKNYPKDLDAALNTFGYEKQQQSSSGGGGAKKKKTTIQQKMDQDFREIKQTTRLFLRSPRTPRATLVKTRNVLEKVLQKVPARYHPELTRLIVAVEARLIKSGV